ncbi:hypothetical protein D046_6272 [Vibrio parahaemolyticus V-223/04]|nr:hypothetical protein D046_6272 [Vibrio parahaemolyticus V-223/04]
MRLEKASWKGISPPPYTTASLSALAAGASVCLMVDDIKNASGASQPAWFSQ